MAHGLAPTAFLDERARAQFGERALQFLLRVHHDRSVPGDWLFERATGEKQEPDALITRLHDDLVSTVEQHERVIRRVVDDRLIAGYARFGANRARLGRIAERT